MASRVSFVRLGASLVQRGPPRAHKALLAEVLWDGPAGDHAHASRSNCKCQPSRLLSVVCCGLLRWFGLCYHTLIAARLFTSLGLAYGCIAKVATAAIRPGDVAEKCSTPPRTRDGGLGTRLDALAARIKTGALNAIDGKHL